ncbi:MAG: DMT family transporter [Ferrovibrio sp.]|uniref:DMT family transporter n=1 Tax=Ferrovibrio sp. TaxID=1917215 RepID=UPI00261E627A|nr:DMT family transporter [Ferrovibrio sp.]MCW0236577.1 DMT family transporter [Ferrovibrio sp.]
MSSASAVTASQRAAQRLALAALVLGALAIAFSPIFVRLSEVGPTATGFYRTILAVPPLWLVWRFRPADAAPRASETSWGIPPLGVLLIPGLLFAGDLFFWHLSIKYTSVANATLLSNFAPVIVTLGAWLVLREKITSSFLVALLVAFCGALMLVGASFRLGGDYVFGDLLAFTTAIFYGAYMIAVAKLRGRHGTQEIMLWSSLVSGLALLPMVWLMGESLWPATLQGWAILFGLAWISHALGQGLIAYALGHLPASFSSLVVLVQPVAAAFFGWLWLGEGLQPLQIAGGAVVLIGILLARRAQLKG